MKGFWLFVHNLGYTLWLGGGIATMIAGVAAKRFPAAERLGVYRVNGAVWRLLVGPAAMATLLSGLVLAMQWMKTGAAPGWKNAMMGVGLLGGLVAVAMAMPAASCSWPACGRLPGKSLRTAFRPREARPRQRAPGTPRRAREADESPELHECLVVVGR